MRINRTEAYKKFSILPVLWFDWEEGYITIHFGWFKIAWALHLGE